MRAHRHQHRLGKSCRPVIQACIGDIHAGQRGDHGLIFVQQLQRALARLGLVRGIGGVKFAACDDLPDGCGNVVFVSACADKIQIAAINFSTLLHQARYVHFGQAFRHAR